MADALEAIIGAVLLDGGEVACQKVVLNWYAQRLETISPTSVLKDPKTQLQEWLQGRQRPLPLYEVVEITGQAPKQEFKVSCVLTDADKSFTAQGSSRRRAEQRAAAAALAELEEKKQ